MSVLRMPSVVHSDEVSEYNQKIAVNAYYPGHEVRIIGAQGNDVMYELYEYGDVVDDHDWMAPLIDDIGKELLNNQGAPMGILIMEGKIRYGVDDSEPPELAGEWEIRRPTEDEIRELVDGTFTREIP